MIDKKADTSSIKQEDNTLNLVINYPYQITGSGKTKIHVCLFKPDFSPAEGAEVRINNKIVGNADSQGVMIFDYSPGNLQSHRLEANLKEGELTYSVIKEFSCRGRTESFRSDQIYLYTDRGVYNPGDTILVRLIAWELLEDYRAISRAEVTLLLQSPQGRIFGGEKLITNEYGIASSKLPLAKNMPEGEYELVVIYKQAREVTRLQVKRFVPPTIEIRHNLKRYLTCSQESLPVKVELSYFSGGKPKSSKMNLTIIDNQNKIIGETSQNEISPGLYDFVLSGSFLDDIKKKLRLGNPFNIIIEVTDNYGQRATLTRDMVYTERPFFCILEFDKDDYPAGETVKLLAKVVDLDGKPAGNLPLKCIVSEFRVDTEATTDENGVALFSFTMGSRQGNAIITSSLMPSPLANEIVRFSYPKPMSSKVSEPPQKEGVSTHFTVHFSPDYIPVEKVVHVDFTDYSGGIVAATTIPVTRLPEDSYIAQGTVKGNTWGTMLANLYCCAVERRVLRDGEKLSIFNVGFITEGQHVTLYPDRELSITIADLKPRVSPGDQVNLEVIVATKSGQEAAIGASLVDKAVISLMDPFELSPQDRFYNPQLKVISTGGAAVLTWPVVDRNWGEPWRDIAYSNWGFKSPGNRPSKVKCRGADSIGMEEPSLLSWGGDQPGIMFCSKSEEMPSLEAPSAPLSMCDLCQGTKGTAEGKLGLALPRTRSDTYSQTQPKVITIRTKFPETALWEPFLKTEKGSCRIEIKFPDSITVQRLSIIATDREGRLGVVHRDIEVNQDIFIHPDAPAVMTLCDAIQITGLLKNSSGLPCKITATFQSSDFELQEGGDYDIEISPGQEMPLLWKVMAHKCGRSEFTLRVFNDNFEDSEQRTIFVRPPGIPRIDIRKGVIKVGSPFKETFKLDEKALYHTVFLNVSFPDIIPAIQAWYAVEELPLNRIGVAGLAGRVLCDCALLSWAEDKGGLDKQAIALRERLMRALTDLLSVQNPDGSWGWFPIAETHYGKETKQANVYITTLVLKALCEMATNSVFIHKETVMSAIAYSIEFINNSSQRDGLWSYEGSFFWEVNAQKTCWSLSAEIFDTLVSAYRILGKPYDARIMALKEKIYSHLKEKPNDPAFVAHAIKGLMNFGRALQDQALLRETASFIDYLFSLKRRGHWEPDWYHAYGGMIELNALIIELLHRLGKDRYESQVREITTYLLATRKAWGAWHNESGTGIAMRALFLSGAESWAENQSNITVRVNGEKAASISIDRKDPFPSAARLRYMELTSYCRTGENEVEVSYNGKLIVPAFLEIKEWPRDLDITRKPELLTIQRNAPHLAGLGELVEVTLAVTASRRFPIVQINDTIPSNMSIDESSLRKLIDERKIAQFHIEDDVITLSLVEVSGLIEITYRLAAIRSGKARHSGTTAKVPIEGWPSATYMGEPITVSN